jgi:NO-binding membrane sensor protein with MHYT domain
MKAIMNLALALLCLGLLFGSLFCIKTDPGLALGLGISGMLMTGMTGMILTLTNSPAPENGV